MTNYGQFRHIIIPTTALSAINSLPKLNPSELIAKWLGDAVIHLVWTQRTTMIDRALAEDLAAVFRVSVRELPDDIVNLRDFIREYVDKLLGQESLDDVITDLQGVTHNLNFLISSMVQSINGHQ